MGKVTGSGKFGNFSEIEFPEIRSREQLYHDTSTYPLDGGKTIVKSLHRIFSPSLDHKDKFILDARVWQGNDRSRHA